MKSPRLRDVKLDVEGTKKMRRMMANAKKIKITINLDSDLLSNLRQSAGKKGTPYQTYMNWLLREAMAQKVSEEDRLDRLEREVALIKKKLAA